MFTKKTKIILSTLLLALAIGYVGLYHWAKNRFTELHQEYIQQMQAEGWTIERSPLTFSGFPFRLTANQEICKASNSPKPDVLLTAESKNIKMHVSILNPFKYSFEGDATLSVALKDVTVAKATWGNGSVIIGYKEGKLEPIAAEIHGIKFELPNPETKAPLILQVETLGYEAGDYKISDMDNNKILQSGGEYILKDLDISSTKDGTSTTILQLKKAKAAFKGKMPQTVLEQIKAIFTPAKSPMVQICQAGGKVPPLKSTVDLMEKVESYGKVNLEVEHKDYVINLDLDAKILKHTPELLLTIQVSNLNSLFDAFNLDPTMRFIANGFVKKESEKSEKAHLIVKFSAGSLFVNDMEILKVPMPDWDNIVLPADVCSKYAPMATTPTAKPSAAAPLVRTPY
jgi:hypothetical protein